MTLQRHSVNSGDSFLRESDHIDAADVNITFSWQCLYQRAKLMLFGHSDTLPRTANLVQVLGNMTVTFYWLFSTVLL